MQWSRLLVLALSGAMLASPAWAQDDDDLAPLTPKKKAAPAKAAPKKKAPPPPPAAKKAPVAAPAATPAADDDLAPLAPVKTELVIKLAGSSNTKRAKVSIDDKEVGTLPLPPQLLNTGEHTVTVRAPGFAPWTKKIAIVGTKPNEVTVALDATAALVSVNSDSPGAEVIINGKNVGTTPMEEMEIPPGSTTIVIRKEGFKEASTTAKLVAGREYPISVKLGPAVVADRTVVAESDRPENTSLTPSSSDSSGSLGLEQSADSGPVYKRWYVWAGAAAVVAAVAVGVAVGVSSSSGGKKGPSEGEICGTAGVGKCDACIGFMCGATGLLKF